MSHREEKILTLHPEGKAGVNISRSKYDQVRRFITEQLKQNGLMTYKDLSYTASILLSPEFDGSVSWYLVTVKLDLEARGILERVNSKNGHIIKLKTRK